MKDLSALFVFWIVIKNKWDQKCKRIMNFLKNFQEKLTKSSGGSILSADALMLQLDKSNSRIIIKLTLSLVSNL